MIKSWSYSKLLDYEQCPYRVKLKYLDKVPQGPAPAAERGTMIHGYAEDYVMGKLNKLPGELAKFSNEFEVLRTEYKAKHVSLEGEWGFDRDWMPTDYKGAWLRMKGDAILFQGTSAVVIDYKGLDVTTKLPTPSGWTTMGDVKVGDTLFSQNGKTCIVTGKSKVKHLPCYEITFDDTTKVICDEEHLWTLTDGAVVATPKLTNRSYIATCNAVELPEQTLPIDPYVLGFWIADGKHTSGEITKPDEFIWGEVKRLGYELGVEQNENNEKCRSHTILGLRTELRKLGLLGNKHIPQIYMRASVKQRLSLLQGLMDGDGSVNPKRKQVILQSVEPELSKQYLELIHSLGQRATRAWTLGNGFGKICVAYPISFRPNGINPFRLPRKADACKDFGPGRSQSRRVKSVNLIDSVPTQCIAVDSHDHTFLCTERFLPTHNTGASYGNELKHGEQCLLYAIATFVRQPKVESIKTELWYLDKDELMQREYTRPQALRFVQPFTKRAEALCHEKDFHPNANIFTCKWCPFGPAKGGQCEYGVDASVNPMQDYRKKYG